MHGTEELKRQKAPARGGLERIKRYPFFIAADDDIQRTKVYRLACDSQLRSWVFFVDSSSYKAMAVIQLRTRGKKKTRGDAGSYSSSSSQRPSQQLSHSSKISQTTDPLFFYFSFFFFFPAKSLKLIIITRLKNIAAESKIPVAFFRAPAAVLQVVVGPHQLPLHPLFPFAFFFSFFNLGTVPKELWVPGCKRGMPPVALQATARAAVA